MIKSNILKKCLSIVTTEKFKKLDSSPGATCQSKVQHTLRKMKFKFTEQEYYKLYPSGWNAEKFYDTAKIHKLKQGGAVEQLSLQPMVSNCGTVS